MSLCERVEDRYSGWVRCPHSSPLRTFWQRARGKGCSRRLPCIVLFSVILILFLAYQEIISPEF